MPLIEVAGRKVYYESHGDGAADPLLLVSGMAGTCDGWLAFQVPAFQDHRRTIIFDLRGVGESEDPGGPFTIGDLADDAAGLLDALGIERVAVLGAFLGGMISQELTLRHPERVERLVLVGTFARPDAKRRLLLEKWRDMVVAGMPPGVLLRERLTWTLQDETLEQSDLIEAMTRTFPDEDLTLSPDLLRRQCEAALAHDTADRLREITQPTLVICGRHDQLTPPRLHRELADEIPGARLVTLPYGAHLVIAEAAERFNDTVLQFLAEANG